jgi:hypothetical protein
VESNPHKSVYEQHISALVSSSDVYPQDVEGRSHQMANDREQFDANSFLADFDKEFEVKETPQTAVPEIQDTKQATPAPADVEKQVEEPKEEALPEEQPAEEPVEEQVAEEPNQENVAPVNDPDLHKRNEAFKKLREEKEKLEQSDKFLSELANQYGVSKDELMKKFKDDRLKKEAEKQGIPLDQFKRMQSLEQEVQTIKQRYQQETFNYEAERLVQKYNIPGTEVETIFQKIGELGLDVVANPKLLEVAYKALNYDVALTKGRQAVLEETKKRRETTASPSLGTKGGNVDTSAADMDAEIDSFLKEKLGK